MTEINMIRNNPLVDPQMHIWGWEIPVYLFLGGLTAGIMILSPLLVKWMSKEEGRTRFVRSIPFAAPVLLSLGMLALFLDLENRQNVFRFYFSFQLTSPMSWGAWILVVVYPATIALGLGYMTDAEAQLLNRLGPFSGLMKWVRQLSQKHLSIIQLSNLVFGIGLGAYTGLLLGTLSARAVWDSVLLGPLFLVSGISTGAALMMLGPLSHNEHALLRRWDVWAITLEIILIFLFMLDLITSGQAGIEAASLFFGGRFTAVFWSLVIIAGLVIPLMIESIELQRSLLPTALAPALLLVGGFFLRWILVFAGQT